MTVVSAHSPARRRFAVAFAALCLPLLVACGDDEDAGSSPAAVGFPVTVDNCGEQVTFDEPPSRAVGYYQHPTELMLALGLQESIVGTAYPDNPPLQRYAQAYREIPEISEKDASFEQILQVEPDFVYGGWDSAFDDSAGRSQDAFADAGIRTYLNPENCADDRTTIDDVWEEIRTIATIFGVPERADNLIGELQAGIENAQKTVAGVTPLKVFVYDSGDDTAFTAGGQGVGNQIIELAGGRNVFADVADDFADVSWEQVVTRNPDVIAIYDYFGTPSVEDKKAFLLGKPELANVPAIRDERFVVLTLQDAVLGVRAPVAVPELAKQLHPDRFQ